MNVILGESTNSIRLRREVLTWMTLLNLFLLGELFASTVLTLPWSPALRGDSSRYLDGNIRQGTAPFVGYVALVWLAGLIGSSSVIIVIFHGFLAVVAAQALIDIGTQLNSAAAGWILVC